MGRKNIAKSKQIGEKSIKSVKSIKKRAKFKVNCRAKEKDIVIKEKEKENLIRFSLWIIKWQTTVIEYIESWGGSNCTELHDTEKGTVNW